MAKVKNFKTIFPAVSVPLNADYSINEPEFRAYLKWIKSFYNKGIQGLVVNGHTGEITGLTRAERKRAVEICAEECGDIMTIISGVNCENTQESIEMAAEAKAAGADGILLMPPHMWLRFGMNANAPFQYIKDVAEGADIDIIIHLYPATSKANYPVETLIKMCKEIDHVKHHTSAYWLQQAKEYSDSLCREHGLSICVKGKTFDGQERTDATAWSKDKYQLMEKAASGEAHSFLLDIAVAVCLVLKSALNREDFVQGLLDYGISTAWTDKRKYITFTDLEGNKVRNKKLTETFHFDFSKESLEHEFTKRCREASERQPTAPLATARSVTGRVQKLDVGGHSGVTPPAETASRPDKRASDQRQSLASRLERARKSVAEQNQRQSEQSFSFDELLAEGIRESERQNQQQQRKAHRRELER